MGAKQTTTTKLILKAYLVSGQALKRNSSLVQKYKYLLQCLSNKAHSDGRKFCCDSACGCGRRLRFFHTATARSRMRFLSRVNETIGPI